MEISFHRQAKTACPTYFAGAGGFACRSNGQNQWSASKMNKFPKTVKHPIVAYVGPYVRIRVILTSDRRAKWKSWLDPREPSGWVLCTSLLPPVDRFAY